MSYNFLRGGRKDSKNGREEELESQNVYNRVKDFSNDKRVRNPG
jgi:hypothetical protein